MPILTLEEANYVGLIPEDEVLQARITAITQRKKPFQAEDGSDIWRMEFSFVIEQPDSPFDGSRIWGDTSTNFNTHPDCKLRAWTQEILSLTEMEPGFTLDTDVLVGNRCRVVVGVRRYTKDGEAKERNFVRDVMRMRESHVYAGVDEEEPF
jgi:hypothetical protein